MKTYLKSAIAVSAVLTLTGTMSFAEAEHHDQETPTVEVQAASPFVGQPGMLGMGNMGGMQNMGGDHMKMMQSMMKMHATMMPGMGGGGAQERLIRAMLNTGQDDITAIMKAHDASGDGTLDLDEFAHWYAATMREKTVDGFQHLDADGTGAVTTAELTAAINRAKTYRSMAGMGSSPMPGMAGTDGDAGANE